MREALMRLAALSALSAVSEMLTPEGGARHAARFIGGLLTACVLLELTENLGRMIGL